MLSKFSGRSTDNNNGIVGNDCHHCMLSDNDLYEWS